MLAFATVRILVLCLATVGLLLAGGAPVWAQPGGAPVKRVVVEGIGGPQGGRLERLLLSNLQEASGIEVVSEDEAEEVARELGIDRRRWQEEDYVAIAEQLNVAAFIDGYVRRRRRRWGLIVRVRNGADGSRLGGRSWGGRTVGSLRGVRRNAYARLERYLQKAEAPAKPEPEPKSEGESGSEGEGGPEGQGAGTGTQQADSEGEDREGGKDDSKGDEGQDEQTDTDDSDDDSGPDAPRAYPGLGIQLLGGTLSRSLDATADVAACLRDPPIAGSCTAAQSNTNIITEDRQYQSGGIGHAELGFQMSLYPGALIEDRTFPWLGAMLRYRHSAGVKTTAGACRDGVRDCPEQDVVDVSTSQRDIYLAARGRYWFWFGERALRLRGEVGWGNFRFRLSPEDLQLIQRDEIVPPFSYNYAQLGAAASVDLVPVYLSLGGEFGWRFGLGVGADTQRIWGAQTTDTQGFIAGVELRSRMPYVVEGAYVGLQVQFFRFETTFEGQSLCAGGGTNCPDTELWEPWPYEQGALGNTDNVVGGLENPVQDTYIRTSLVLGYEYTVSD